MPDWGTIAAIIVACVAVLGLIVQFFKREKPWKKEQVELRLRIFTLENKMDNISERIEILKSDIEDHDRRDERDFERLETKIEKITDLMIQMIASDHSSKPYPPRDKNNK